MGSHPGTVYPQVDRVGDVFKQEPLAAVGERGRVTMPAKFDELTPEQREAMARFAEEMAHAIQAMIDAFEAFGRACVEANEAMTATRQAWDDAAGHPTPGDDWQATT